MSYKYILFDLDGTITDPKIGITKAVQYALAKYDIHEPSLDKLEKFIGPPLKDSFIDFYSFEEDKAVEAITYFREYFSDIGIFENQVYAGIPELLKALRKENIILAIATSKPTVFAKRVLEHFELEHYFDVIIGSHLDGTRTDKAEVIKYVLKTLEINKHSEVLMIGDRKHDIIGAKKNGIDSIGVLFGYGSREEMEVNQPTNIVKSVKELEKLLKGMCGV